MSRVLSLYQISLEGCAKIEILGSCATSPLAGHKLALAKLRAALISHARKNRTNPYLLEGCSEEETAKEPDDVNGAVEAILKMEKDFDLKSNAAKNAPLCVDFSDEVFSAPVERITLEMVVEIAVPSGQFLGLSSPKVEMLRKWEMAPEQVSGKSVRLEKHIREPADEY